MLEKAWDLVLGQTTLSLYRRSALLDEEPLGRDEVPEPPPRLDGADGYVVWSQPIATTLSVLRRRHDAIRYIPRQYQRFSV